MALQIWWSLCERTRDSRETPSQGRTLVPRGELAVRSMQRDCDHRHVASGTHATPTAAAGTATAIGTGALVPAHKTRERDTRERLKCP